MIQLYNHDETQFNKNGINIKARKAEVYRELDGDYSLNLEVPLDYAEALKQDMIVTVPTPWGIEPFRINNPEKGMSALKVTGKHVFFDSKDYVLLDVAPTNRDGQEALEWVLERTDNPNSFTAYSDVVDLKSARFVRKSLYEALSSLGELYNGHVVPTGFKINLLAQVGSDKGVTFKYGKNLKGIKALENWDNVVTKLLPVGFDGVTLPETYLYADIEHATPYTKVVNFDPAESVNTENEEEIITDLRLQAEAYIEKNKYPLVNYVVEALAQDVGLGDTIKVEHEKAGIDILTKVIAMSYDVIGKRYTRIEFGNFAPSIKGLVNQINKTINDVKDTQANRYRDLEVALDESKDTIMDYLLLGHKHVTENAIYFLDNPDPAQAQNFMILSLGGIGFGSDGINGSYETAWTLDGKFNANFITTGEMSANRIRTGKIVSANGKMVIDLDDDIIRIGSGNTIEEEITQAQLDAEANSTAYMNVIKKDLQGQIDGNIETFQYSNVPTLENEPAVNWTTHEERYKHKGDLYYVVDDSENPIDENGYTYRFSYTESEGFYWNLIKDNDVTKALRDILIAQETADSKMKIFVSQPTNAESYDIGDLWIRDGEVWTCKVAKIADAAFSINHWEKKLKYTDDTVANENLDTAKTYAETKALEALQEAELDATNKANLAKEAAQTYADTKAEAERILAESYADGIVSAEEQARIDDVEAKLELAKTHAEEQDILAKKAAQEYADLVAKGSSMIDKDYQSGVSLMSEKADDSVVHADMDGESFQDGEPSPDNPIEIKSVGTYNLDTTKYEFDVVSHGKNLCGYNDSLPVTKNGVLFSYKDGVYTVKGATAAGAYPYHAIFTIKANTLSDGVYYLKRNNIHTSGTTLACIRIIDRTTTPYPFNVSGDIPFTITGGHNDLLVEIACTQNAVYDCSFNIQIERGNVFTGYTPFQGINKIAISLDEPLRKIGDVADRVFRDSDELWKVERVTAETTFTGQSVILENAKENGMYFCTHKQSGNLDGKTLTLEESVDDLVTVIYELANPTITALPDEMQISLNNLQTYEGTNYVYTVGTEIEPTLHGTFKSEAWYRNYQLQNKMQNTIDELADAQDSLDNLSDTVIPALEDNLISESEKKAIKASLKQFESEKADLDAQYNVIYNNSNLTGTAKSDLQTAKTTYNSRFSALNTAVNNILTATGTVSQSLIDVYETAYLSYKTSLGNLSEKLQEAVRSIEDKIKSDGENYADSAVDGLEIGGRNLLLNTDFSIGSEPWKAQGHVISVDNDVTYDDRNSLKVISTSDGILSSNRFYAFIPTTTKVYGEVTVSFYAKGETSNQVQARTSSTVFTFELTTDWKRFYFTAPKTGTNDRVVMCLVNAGTAWFNGFKFEKGNKATDWTPAPEDIYTKGEADAQLDITKDTILATVEGEYVTKTYAGETLATVDKVSQVEQTVDGIQSTVGTITTDLTGVEDRVSTAESNITQNATAITARVLASDYDSNNTAIDTRFTEVEQTANKISWLVTGESQAEMELTEEALTVIADNIELTADNIKLEGLVTANNNFKVNLDGSVTTNDITILGGRLDLKSYLGATPAIRLTDFNDLTRVNLESEYFHWYARNSTSDSYTNMLSFGVSTVDSSFTGGYLDITNMLDTLSGSKRTNIYPAEMYFNDGPIYRAYLSASNIHIYRDGFPNMYALLDSTGLDCPKVTTGTLYVGGKLMRLENGYMRYTP